MKSRFLFFVCFFVGYSVLAQQVRYEFSAPNAVHHEAEISLSVSGLPAGPVLFRMSRSSPGRYATHEFGKNVYIDGRVYNPITNEGIEGISLKIYRTQIDTKDPIGDSYKTLETTNTDSEGHYKMEHLSSIFNQVYVAFNQGNFYLISSNYSYPIKKGKRNHME